jgi:hypothetical protein
MLMESQHEAVVALRELERHDVVVVALRSRLVAGVGAFAVDENAHTVVSAEEEQKGRVVREVQRPRGITHDVSIARMERGDEVDGSFSARSDAPSGWVGEGGRLDASLGCLGSRQKGGSPTRARRRGDCAFVREGASIWPDHEPCADPPRLGRNDLDATWRRGRGAEKNRPGRRE